MVFLVCCILHNLCIDDRLENGDEHPRCFPTRQRYTQRPNDVAQDTLNRDDDFEYVVTVDESQAAEVINAGENAGPNPPFVADDTMSAKDKQMYRIAEMGYVRPRANT